MKALESVDGMEDGAAVPAVAIIGMACRVPGASNVEEFWELLRSGTEAIKFFSESELLEAGVDAALLNDPSYVRAKGVLSGAESFDARFFGYSPREAELTDPQQRVFLECAWSSLEDAGYDPDSYAGTIGVYAGAAWNSYLLFNIATHPGLLQSESGHQILLGNEKDNLSTRVSYKLNLRGPSVTIQTGCSTSLVACALAYHGLITYQCDMALAGGVAVTVPQAGYMYQSGGIFSPDGHCRPFDASAQGTVIGSGVGVVVLKRLEDAVTDGDNIYAVIRGACVNNDGAQKAGYTAPSTEGQATVILDTHAQAGVSAETITYVEAHGTATALGDPIEMAALTRAFRTATTAQRFCAVGSVKSNIGHLDAAAGIAGLIKTVLMLQHKQIPGTVHFARPNPEIDFANGPFFVNTSLSAWTSAAPLRAGVSSFGLGGTNAHMVVEEGPPTEESLPARGPILLPISAKTETALKSVGRNLALYLEQHPESNLSDVAYTLQVGRRAFSHRRTIVCQSASDAIRGLREDVPGTVVEDSADSNVPGVALMFGGQGTQYVDMARSLYDAEPTFRQELSTCLDLLASSHGLELRPILYPVDQERTLAAHQLQQTQNAQPALFAVEYALARMWMSAGVKIRAMIGHSVGEYVAATLAGVFSLEDALSLVVSRGRLIQSLAPGAMLAVPISAEQAEPHLPATLTVAAINEPTSCVVSGPTAEIQALEEYLGSRGIQSHYLRTSHAFHSPMMDPALAAYARCFEGVRLNVPKIPFISNVTGDWITATLATDPNYWVRHVREPVLFAQGLERLLSGENPILLEAGPGQTLTTFVRRHTSRERARAILSSVPPAPRAQAGLELVLSTLGELWQLGVEVDWQALNRDGRRRVALPTYPFDRQRYWMDPPSADGRAALAQQPSISSTIWSALVEAVRRQGRSEVSRFDVDANRTQQTWLDGLSLAYLRSTFHDLNAFGHVSEAYSAKQLLTRCDIAGNYEQLFSSWLKLLVDAGQLELTDDGLFRSREWSPNRSPRALLREARATWVGPQQPLDLVELCGEALKDVVRGLRAPVELFTDIIEGSGAKSQEEFGLNTGYTTLVKSGLEQVVQRLPSHARLRILEIGGGTGIATSELLGMLPPERTTYTFTDIASLFLTQARRKFRDYPFVTYKTLDIERPPSAQGYDGGAFDIIIGINVLHAVRNIHGALSHVRELLAPGGFLLIGELTRPTADFAITYGLLMNPIEDCDRNQGNPFLRAEAWEESLRGHGFEQVASAPEGDVLGHNVVLAQASMTSRPGCPSGNFAQPAFSHPADNVVAPAGSASAGLLKKPDVADWFYVPSWKRSALPSLSAPTQQSCWLLFVNALELEDQLLARLEDAGGTVITVRAGERFHRNSAVAFVIDPAAQGDYALLLEHLYSSGHVPQRIVHLWSLTPSAPAELTLRTLELSQPLGINSLLFLAEALGARDFTEPLQICVVSNGIHDVAGDRVAPDKALLLAPCRVIPLEYPNISCRIIDVVLPDAGSSGETFVQPLLVELQSDSRETVVAYRGSHRWLQATEPVRLTAPVESNLTLREQGVYLITGGLGKIGLSLSLHLAQTMRAKLILVRRTPFPARQDWDDWLLRHPDDERDGLIMHGIREMEALGAEVCVEVADVADLEQMKGVVQRSVRRFGNIHGVIHAAGALGDGAIAHKSLDELQSVLSPKVAGTIVLGAIFCDVPLDFFVVFSSLSATRPGFGQVAYSAANNFLEAVVHTPLLRRCAYVGCLAWDVWQGDGMAYDAVAPLALREVKERDFAQRGILPREGVDVFLRVLASKLPHVLVSTSDYLNTLNASNRDLSQLYLDALVAKDASRPAHSRPSLKTEYAPPTSSTEELVAEIWRELLGMNEIGINDDFFELGGDSLIGTQLITRVKKAFGVKLSAQSVYNHPTIRTFSEAITQGLLARAGSERLNELVKKLV